MVNAKWSAAVLLTHSPLTNYFFTKKENSRLEGAEEACGLEKGVCVTHQSAPEGEEPALRKVNSG